MRGILRVSVVAAAAIGVAGPAVGDAPCSGNACSAVAVAADGCSWSNKGDKAVRLSLITGQTARVVTVIAPGETFREANKAFCSAENAGDKRFEASFAVLGKPPADDKDFTLKAPRSAPAAAATPVAAVAATTEVAAAPPIVQPRAKPAPPPAYPPTPRAKPEVIEVAAPAPAAPAAPVAAVQPAAPARSAAAAPSGPSASAAACGQGCPPVLFKVIDECLWVLNLNPRPVAFEAEVGGKKLSLALEAADGAKADEGAKSDGALHMRLKDPFQSAGSGIPVYRARLGGAGACVKSREEIAAFSAAYVK